MAKNSLHVVMLIALAIGAAYSYDEVRFGERTASFFRVAFSDEASGQVGRGRHGFDRRGRGNDGRRDRRTPTGRGEDASGQSGESVELTRQTRGEIREQPESMRATPVDRAEMRERVRGRSRELRGRGRHGGRGAAISLEEVGHYTIIFAFATMFTFTIDGLARRTRKS